MKSDWSRNFYTQIAVNIFYSALIACLVDAFLIMNINLLLAYLDQTRYANMMIFQIFRMGTITTILYVLIGIGVFSLTLLLLERKTMKYIGKIAMAIQNISEGDLNTQIEVVGDDEFSAMASNLNRMEADIRKLMDKERESERTKNELITNVAHDLRTPLTSIIGYLELLSSGPAISQEMQKKYIDIAYVKAKRLEKLIEDLFGFTKMNYGRISMNVGKVDIVKLLGQLLEEFYPSFMDKDLTYELKSNVPSQVITADGNLLARLFDNLINNAIKFTQQGCITVGFRKLQKGIEFYVQDTGIGIIAENIQLIFNRFEKLNHFAHGTGLGLTICRNLVEKLDGTIGVESEPGIGSRFWFTVPYEPAGLHRAEDALLPPSHGLSQISPGKPVILVAEDTDSNFLLVSLMFRKEFDIVRAVNGEEAVRICREMNPAAILMDIKMPVMDGFEAMRRTRAFDPAVPIVAVTAFAYDRDRQKAFAAGANGYVAKTLSGEHIRRVLGTLLAEI